MKVIDDKGRLFGKINIIDFTVLLFMITVIPVFYYGYKIITKKNEVVAVKKDRFDLEVNCLLIKLQPEDLEKISVGAGELDEQGNVIGEIISLGEVSSYTYRFRLGEGQEIFESPGNLQEIKARLRLRVDIKSNQAYYKDAVVNLNAPLKFNINGGKSFKPPYKEIEGVVIGEGIFGKKEIDFNVMIKDLTKDVLKKVSIGDKELDKDGKTIAEIINLGKIENNAQVFDLGGNTFIKGEDPKTKQIYAKMRLQCEVKNVKELYFKNKQLKENTLFEFKTDTYKAKCMLAMMLETKPVIRKRWLSLQVKFSNLVPEIANVIHKEDTGKDISDNSTNGIIRSITENISSKIITLNKNELITVDHPYYRELLISLDVLCIEKEGAYYFNNYIIKMGSNITFATNLYSISGLIIGMEFK